VCVCVCVCCGGEGGALIVKARVCVCVCVCCGGEGGALLAKARDALEPPALLVLGTQAGRPRELG